MAWKKMKQFVTVAGIFGASKWTNLKRAFGALTAEWGNLLLSNTGIRNVFLGKVNLTPIHLRAQFMKANQFYPEFAIVGISIASIQNTSKRLDLR